jgi:hypothetical protein
MASGRNPLQAHPMKTTLICFIVGAAFALAFAIAL